MKLDTAKDRNLKRKSDARRYYCTLWLARGAAVLYRLAREEMGKPK